MLPHRWYWSPLSLRLRKSSWNIAWQLSEGASGSYTMTSSKLCSPMGPSSRVGVTDGTAEIKKDKWTTIKTYMWQATGWNSAMQWQQRGPRWKVLSWFYHHIRTIRLLSIYYKNTLEDFGHVVITFSFICNDNTDYQTFSDFIIASFFENSNR